MPFLGEGNCFFQLSVTKVLAWVFIGFLHLQIIFCPDKYFKQIFRPSRLLDCDNMGALLIGNVESLDR